MVSLVSEDCRRRRSVSNVASAIATLLIVVLGAACGSPGRGSFEGNQRESSSGFAEIASGTIENHAWAVVARDDPDGTCFQVSIDGVVSSVRGAQAVCDVAGRDVDSPVNAAFIRAVEDGPVQIVFGRLAAGATYRSTQMRSASRAPAVAPAGPAPFAMASSLNDPVVAFDLDFHGAPVECVLERQRTEFLCMPSDTAGRPVTPDTFPDQ